MILTRFHAAALLLAASLGTAACSYDNGHGYGGLSVGYGAGYGDPYYDGYGYGAGYGAFGSPYWGWYNGFYYPGTGIYVYDQYRRPHRWNDYQRRYWADRRDNWRGRRDGDRNGNWRDFQRGDATPGSRGDGRRAWRQQSTTAPQAQQQQPQGQVRGEYRQRYQGQGGQGTTQYRQRSQGQPGQGTTLSRQQFRQPGNSRGAGRRRGQLQ